MTLCGKYGPVRRQLRQAGLSLRYFSRTLSIMHQALALGNYDAAHTCSLHSTVKGRGLGSKMLASRDSGQRRRFSRTLTQAR